MQLMRCGSITAAVVVVLGVLAGIALRMSNKHSSDAPLGSGAMFDSIAGQYDIVNRFLSFGMDMHWRRRLLSELQLQANDRVLDLATGTADVAILIAEDLIEMSEAAPDSTGRVQVVGIDPSANMLAQGNAKLASKGLTDAVKLRLGDAQDLKDLQDSSFDKVSMSFGIRNVPDRRAALREIARVAAPGATVAIMDLHTPVSGVLAPVARAAISVMPTALGLLSGAPEQYKHLERSVLNFPDPEQWQSIMADAGLPVYKAVPMCFGAVWLYLATPAKAAAATDDPGDTHSSR